MSNLEAPGRIRGSDVQLTGVSKRYGETVALERVDLDVRAGEFMTFLGPSGGGKTTTLNLIAGFDDPSSGQIHVGGKSMAGVPAHLRDIGMVFQNYALFPHMTVNDNIAYPLVQRKVPKPERRERVREALASVGLSKFGTRKPAQLSGGQQQRVALARAMVYRPGLLLMDEPLGALDRSLREELQFEIRRIHREQGSTAVYVTHDQEEALVLSDRIAVFSHGRIQQVGAPIDLYDRPATLFVGRFLGESTVLAGRVRRVESDAVMVEGEFGEAWVRGNLPSASEVAVMIRPEKQTVRLEREIGTTTNNVSARVIDRIFVGSTWKYRLELGDGTIGVVRMPAVIADVLRPGDSGFITWSMDEGVLLPVSPSLGEPSDPAPSDATSIDNQSIAHTNEGVSRV